MCLVVDEGHADEQVEVPAGGVGPQNLPQLHHVVKGQLTLEPDQQPPEAEEEIARVPGAKV